MTKECRLCNELLDIKDFCVDKKSKDGHSSRCKLCVRKYNKSYKEKNKNKLTNFYHQRYQQNKEKYKEYDREHKEYRNEAEKRRKQVNPNYNLSKNTTTLLSDIIKHPNRMSTCLEQRCGYTAKQFRDHIQSQFTSEMNWDNYGSVWEVDHIIPINYFNYPDTNCKDFRICWSLMNLRPLSKHKNAQRCRDGRDISEELKQQILNQKFGDDIV